MSQNQKSPCGTPEHHSCSEIQVFKAMEDSCPSSSYSLMPGSLKDAPAAETPSTSEGPQSTCLSSVVPTTILLSDSSESSSSHDEDSVSLSEMRVDPLDGKVALLVQFLLQKYKMKEPITKADMLDTVIKECKDDFLEILKRTSEGMELVFGVDVKEVDPTSHSYALVNKLGLTFDARLSSDESVPKTSLLIIVLGVIFMKGNRATEEEIWEVLKMLDLHSGRKHPIFGEPRKLITKDLVQEKYLEYQQVPDSDPPCYEFVWGPRAYAETSKMKLLEFLTKTHESDSSCFPLHYQEALRDEVERARARIVTEA
uniref:MAGE family member B16 n=2 Tax=Otolemur garnettii TaxID=30611 RepID=H0XKW2_OTOGA